MTSEADKARAIRWRKANPEKIRAQRQRVKDRKAGLLPPYEKPPKKTPEELRALKRIYNARKHAKHMARLASDPVYAENNRIKHRARAIARYHRTKGDPVAHAEKLRIERERRKAIREQVLAERAKAKAERQAAKPPKMTPEQRLARRREQARARDKIKRDLERQKRALEVANAISSYMPCSEPKKITSDPPELVALFKKASKGEPPRPINPAQRKLTAFQLRGWA